MLYLLLLVLHLPYSLQSAQEYRLIQDLKEKYDTIERPVRSHSEPIPVKLRVLLQQIVDVVSLSTLDSKGETLRMNGTRS